MRDSSQFSAEISEFRVYSWLYIRSESALDAFVFDIDDNHREFDCLLRFQLTLDFRTGALKVINNDVVEWSLIDVDFLLEVVDCPEILGR